MSEFHNDELRKLALRSNCQMMSSEDSFVQGFMMGRKYQKEFDTNLHNIILRKLHASSDIPYKENNYWNDRIKSLEEELHKLKCEYVYERE